MLRVRYFILELCKYEASVLNCLVILVKYSLNWTATWSWVYFNISIWQSVNAPLNIQSYWWTWVSFYGMIGKQAWWHKYDGKVDLLLKVVKSQFLKWLILSAATVRLCVMRHDQSIIFFKNEIKQMMVSSEQFVVNRFARFIWSKR